MLNIFCLWISSKYKLEHIEKLRDDLAKNFQSPYQLICLTDKPNTKLEGVKFVQATVLSPSAWCKLSLFTARLKELGYTGKSVAFNLKTEVPSNIESLVNSAETFAANDDFSIIVFEIPTYRHLYVNFKSTDVATYSGFKDYVLKTLEFTPASLAQVNQIEPEEVIDMAKKGSKGGKGGGKKC